ncbi:MAG: type 1 glutamine amidotransferase [Synergistaceae bacterium]|jgi:GMP synthase-like glutamine amidotransferase|nr:type 1 glutamine amidotransferase [Synergistaceae bacterium]
MRLLFVDNSGASATYSPLAHWKPLFPENFHYVDALQGGLSGLSPGDYSHVILSGSESCTLDEKEWMLEEENFVRAVVAEKIPLLGSCFGHQLIAKVLFGRDAVRVRPKEEVGWKEIRVMADDPLWGRSGETQWGFLFHYDDVAFVPPESGHLTASSEECAVQGFKIRDLPVWGVQAHFEIGVTEGIRLLKDSRYSPDEVQKGVPPRDTGFVVAMMRRFLAQ